MVGQECTGQPCGTADVRAEGSASLPLCPQTLQPSPERLPGGGGPGEPCFSEPGARALRPLPAGTCSLGSRPPPPVCPLRQLPPHRGLAPSSPLTGTRALLVPAGRRHPVPHPAVRPGSGAGWWPGWQVSARSQVCTCMAVVPTLLPSEGGALRGVMLPVSVWQAVSAVLPSTDSYGQ